MKKLLNVLLCLSSLLMINSFVINKKTDFNETPTLINAKGIDIKKVQFGDNEEVKTSDKIYTQWARLDDNSNSTSLRFAIALKGNIETITFTRSEVIGLETTKEANVVNVDTVYKSITANNKNYYYTSEGLSLEDNDSYYWACYTINYSKDSSLKQNNIELSVKINDLDPITTKASLVETQYLDEHPTQTHSFTNKRTTPGVFYTLCANCGTIDGVVQNYVKVDSVDNVEKELDLKLGEEYQLKPTISPANATFKDNIEYTSDNEEVATVDNNGKITALKPGAATIKVKCDGEAPKCVVTVLDDQYLITDSSSLSNGTKETIKTSGWYSNSVLSSTILSMENGIINGEIQSTKTSTMMIRYLPEIKTEEYTYSLIFDFYNNTESDVKVSCNKNGDTKNVISNTITKDSKKRIAVSFSCASVSDFINIKIPNNKGSFTISNIYFIPVTNN